MNLPSKFTTQHKASAGYPVNLFQRQYFLTKKGINLEDNILSGVVNSSSLRLEIGCLSK